MATFTFHWKVFIFGGNMQAAFCEIYLQITFGKLPHAYSAIGKSEIYSQSTSMHHLDSVCILYTGFNCALTAESQDLPLEKKKRVRLFLSSYSPAVFFRNQNAIPTPKIFYFFQLKFSSALYLAWFVYDVIGKTFSRKTFWCVMNN